MKKKQRYCLMFHARVEEAVSAHEKHACFFEGIKGLPAPWGLGDRPVPPLRDFGCPSSPSITSASIGLTKFFGPGVKRALITYWYRRMLKDDSSCDDCLIIDFDPAKVDVHHLIYTVIPGYIEAFDAYLVDYYDERFVDFAYEERIVPEGVLFTPKSKEYVNRRFKVEKVWPVSFYDEPLCRRAFNLSPSEILERLQGKVEHVQLLHGGVYLVGTSQVLSFEEAQKVCAEMTSALGARTAR
jgi:hypothetical protein